MNRILIFVLFLSLFIFSCSKSAINRELSTGFTMDSAPELSAKNEIPGRMMEKNASLEDEGNPETRDRKRILNAYLDLTVNDVDSAEKELVGKTLKEGGWIVSSNLNGGEISLVVKIPAEKFDSFLQDSEQIGSVDSKSITTDDVTESFYDLKNRIENKIILRERFREYLKKAVSIEDILSVERQLNDVTTEIERLEGSFRGLNRDIDYSTVTFRLKPPISETVSNKVPSFKRAFSTLLSSIRTFFYYLFFIVIYLVIFGIPVILVLGLIYFTGWGKVGLIRRFFAKLKK